VMVCEWFWKVGRIMASSSSRLTWAA